jgi:hypothetical protein
MSKLKRLCKGSEVQQCKKYVEKTAWSRLKPDVAHPLNRQAQLSLPFVLNACASAQHIRHARLAPSGMLTRTWVVCHVCPCQRVPLLKCFKRPSCVVLVELGAPVCFLRVCTCIPPKGRLCRKGRGVGCSSC